MRPWTVLEYPAHAATSHVAIEIGSRGPTATPATACVAGIDAIANFSRECREISESVGS